MKIPTTLKHNPVIVSEDYDKIDGRHAGASDAKGLSVGLAQWNDRGKVDVSAKIWRYTGEKWSRQSEEMPLHRVLDLALLICRTKAYFQEAYRYPKLYDASHATIDRLALQGGALDVSVCGQSDARRGYRPLSRRSGEGRRAFERTAVPPLLLLREMGY